VKEHKWEKEGEKFFPKIQKSKNPHRPNLQVAAQFASPPKPFFVLCLSFVFSFTSCPFAFGVPLMFVPQELYVLYSLPKG